MSAQKSWDIKNAKVHRRHTRAVSSDGQSDCNASRCGQMLCCRGFQLAFGSQELSAPHTKTLSCAVLRRLIADRDKRTRRILLEGYAGIQDASGTITTNNSSEFVANLVGEQGFGEDLGSYLVQTDGSDAALAALLESSAHVGMSSRHILPDEARALRASGAGNMIDRSQERIIATDSIVLITHPSNLINRLTIEEVSAIFAGEITNWSDVGGTDLPIVVYAAADDSSARSVCDADVFGNSALTQVTSIKPLPTNSDISNSANAAEAAIGYVSSAFQRGAKSITLTDECGLPAIPDVFSARTFEHPLQQRRWADCENRARRFWGSRPRATA